MADLYRDYEPFAGTPVANFTDLPAWIETRLCEMGTQHKRAPACGQTALPAVLSSVAIVNMVALNVRSLRRHPVISRLQIKSAFRPIWASDLP
jgi:hypothetical protein